MKGRKKPSRKAKYKLSRAAKRRSGGGLRAISAPKVPDGGGSPPKRKFNGGK
jgi:hypothetical protein